ncbi:ABC transporter ATP-binding protein, partial [Candidatus Dependentiae bacterium]|nr:ABC transporter ATP-binding protein [Candidatus Dependentiae bacterium]
MSSETVLRVTELEKTYPIPHNGKGSTQFVALNKVSFTLHSGEILGILGPNGAGKTTLIQILLSVLKPTSGQVLYFGKDFFTHMTSTLQQVSYASGYAKLPSQLRVRENLDIYAQLYGIPKKERDATIEKYLKFFGMWNLAEKEAGLLSAGQMSRVM